MAHKPLPTQAAVLPRLRFTSREMAVIIKALRLLERCHYVQDDPGPTIGQLMRAELEAYSIDADEIRGVSVRFERATQWLMDRLLDVAGV